MVTATPITYGGGGGGGGAGGNSLIPPGGSGGGGNGGWLNAQDQYIRATLGASNTGGGGGGGAGAGFEIDGRNGGSGIVILRYLTSIGTITIGAGLTGSTATDGSHKVTTITAGTGNVSWA
jgi:hypothetical protein